MDPRFLRPSLAALLVLVGVAAVVDLARQPDGVVIQRQSRGAPIPLDGSRPTPPWPSDALAVLSPGALPRASWLPSPTPTNLVTPSPSLPFPSPRPSARQLSVARSADPTSTPGARPTARPTPAPTPRPTPAPTPGPTPGSAPCSIFPADNVWNRDVSTLPVRSDSATLVGSIGLTAHLHPDFSSTAYNGGLGYGIPINKVNSLTPRYPVTFDYADESDPGPYPIPANPKIESGSDAHMLLWDTESCDLYEIYAAAFSGGHWTGGSGAVWDLRSNALRPNGWTSADAAGLPILPGLVRYDEVLAGAIRHALRFTAPRTCGAHIYPARHDAGSWSCATYPPMGLRVRLKASVDLSGFGPQARVILTALKKYGMILADNGSPWYVTGAPNPSWNDDELHVLQTLDGSDFEAVDTSTLRNG